MTAKMGRRLSDLRVSPVSEAAELVDCFHAMSQFCRLGLSSYPAFLVNVLNSQFCRHTLATLEIDY